MGSEIQEYTFKILGIVEICGGEYKENILQKEFSNYIITALCIETQRYVSANISPQVISDGALIQQSLWIAHNVAVDKTTCGSLKVGDIITKDGKIIKDNDFTFTITDIEYISGADVIVIAICHQTQLHINVLLSIDELTDRVAIKKELLKEHAKLSNIIDKKDTTIQIGETI